MARSVGEILQVWAQYDIFFYVLPFLLIFALVFAIMEKLNITGKHNDRGINAVISLTIGLLALQYDRVPLFFQEVFPRLGMGLAVILVALILMGLFVDPKRHQMAVKTFFGIGAVTAVVVLLNAFNDYSWWTGSFWADNVELIVAGVIILTLVGAVIIESGEKIDTKDHPRDPWRNVGITDGK